jgi:peptidoglycan/LPS O-acetylase OafA/YrhL
MSAQVTDTAATAPRVRQSAPRLAWLDALRGFAALCVVFDHGGYLVLQSARHAAYQVIDVGQYGVFVFFLVSGYIVPASLERKGSLRGFWISRGFRLYPMYALAVLIAIIAFKTGYGDIANAQRHPGTSAASMLLMLPDVLTGPNVPNVVWSLSYEMGFYLLLAALFSWRAHRHSGGYALACAVGAVALGGILPMAAFARAAGGPHGQLILDLAVDGALIAAIALTVSGNQVASRIGATVGGLIALLLLTVNQGWPYPWSGLTILALMFTGTLLYRAEQGEARWLNAIAVAAVVLVLVIVTGLWHGTHHGHVWRDQWVSSVLLAAATFAVGLAVRHRKIPAALAWLGLVSYSVYLLHPLVLNAYRSMFGVHRHPMWEQLLIAAGIVGVVIVVSAVTYYAVEKPMQRLGRRVTKRFEADPQQLTGT